MIPDSPFWNNINISLNLLPNSSLEDKWLWQPSSDGIFSIKSAYKTLCLPGACVLWSKLVWNKKTIPRHNFILWLALNKKLYTLDKLNMWGITSSTSCYFCNAGVETHDHLFFLCPFSESVWHYVLQTLNFPSTFKTWQRVLNGLSQAPSNQSTEKWCSAFSAAIYQYMESQKFFTTRPTHPRCY